jgi:hypothetical protein
MNVRRSVLFAALGLGLAVGAEAQYIGVLQSAETMVRGTYKLMVAPIVILGENGADNQMGVGVRGGYAFSDHFDAEAKLGLFEDGTLVGVDGEYWMLRRAESNTSFDFSLTGSLNWTLGSDNRYDTMGFGITPQLSGHVTDNLELCGSLDAAFESVQDAPAGIDDSFQRLFLVPGFEYRLSDTLDLVGELGVGINDDSPNYVGAGITYYVR